MDGEGGILRGTARGSQAAIVMCRLLGCEGWGGEKRAEFRRGDGWGAVVDVLE